jgi:bifunctional DNA-binding transcriptional regulator/antitoxin component of YhaV-PrlF toxin-antitoxin module
VPILGKSKVWGKGYTTVPNTVRKLLALENGDEIKWSFDDNKLTIEKGDM